MADTEKHLVLGTLKRLIEGTLKRLIEGTYTCPDCGEEVRGSTLLYPTDEDTFIYVCPECGCIQTRESIYDQFGEKE